MTTKQTIASNNKIMLLVFFICAALMTSLFIFYITHKQTKPVLSSDDAFIFPIAREIKSFELNTADNKKFTRQDLLGHWTLMFFGFTHCAKVCPTTLDMMNRVYTQLRMKYPNLQVVLVSLDPDRDLPERMAGYLHSYNTEFIGLTGKIDEIRKLQSQLGIISMRDNSKGADYQLKHTSSIMLINPQAQWMGIFKYGMKPKQFAQVFQRSVQPLKPKCHCAEKMMKQQMS